MLRCTSCQAPLPDHSRFCPACGAARDAAPDDLAVTGAGPADDDLTVTSAGPEPPPAPPAASRGPEGRFVPGAVLGGHRGAARDRGGRCKKYLT